MPSLRFTAIFAAATLAACSGTQTNEAAQANDTATAPEAPPPAAVTFASLKGNAAAGQAAFFQCKACHQLEEGKHGLGPSLHKIIGQKAGELAGFNFSPAMKASGIVWTDENIYEFIENPRKMVPGTKMSFAGIPDAQKRADLVAWLKENGGQ